MTATSMNKRRFSIIVREYGDEMELCQCDSNPEQIAKAAKLKKIPGLRTRKYASVRFVDNYATLNKEDDR